MNRLFSSKTKRNVLVPGWIATFGFAALNAPPLGVTASVSLFVLGVVVMPALLLIPRSASRRLAVVKGSPISAGRFPLSSTHH